MQGSVTGIVKTEKLIIDPANLHIGERTETARNSVVEPGENVEIGLGGIVVIIAVADVSVAGILRPNDLTEVLAFVLRNSAAKRCADFSAPVIIGRKSPAIKIIVQPATANQVRCVNGGIADGYILQTIIFERILLAELFEKAFPMCVKH